jgi:hypothetical protein
VATLYDLQGGAVPDGTEVEVLDVLVTATGSQGFYVQERTGGPESAIWVFAGAGWSSSLSVSPGDRLDLVGLFVEAGVVSTLDLANAPAPEVRAVGTAPLPAAAVVPLADLQGASAERWEAVLIRVEDLEISVPDAGAGAFEVGDSAGRVLRVGDQLHTWSRLGEVPVGATVSAVTGPLNQGASYELAPRSDDDIELAAIDVFELNQGQVPLGTEVEVFGLVVSATAFDGVYAQEASGGPYSGVWVYLGVDWELTFGSVVPGDRLDLWGLANEYNGLTELDLVASASPGLVVSGSGPAPAPSTIGVADAGEPWEAVLVEVLDVVVDAPDLGYGEWSVTPRIGGGGATVVIDDKIHAWSGAGTLSAGDRFDSIVGPLHYSFSAFKLEPRDDSDVIAH